MSHRKSPRACAEWDTILSIMTTWALENAIETADSMRSRGYGLPGRTSFSIFRLDARDKVVLLIMTGLIALVAVGAVLGENTMRFYPSIKASTITPFSILIYIAYFALCMIPVLINMVEEMKWKSIESKN